MSGRTVACVMSRRWMPALLIVSTTGLSQAGASWRQRIEEDWCKQDAARLAEIRQPGQVWLVDEKIAWPGVRADQRPRVPKTPSPKLDGRQTDACWADALELTGKQPKTPSVRLVHDGASLFVAVSLPTTSEASFSGDPTARDAGGAVDGVKNGRYAFHTNHEPNPWWQVDLGRRCQLGKIVVWNRLDYPPGLHNADKLLILVSDDGATWRQVYDNKGKHFGGVGQGKPLTVTFDEDTSTDESKTSTGKVTARYVRLQIKSPTPIFLHLDEVEVFAAEAPDRNIALHRPARQSSLSIWSRGLKQGGSLLRIGNKRVGFGRKPPRCVTIDGQPVPAERSAVRRTGGKTHIEIAFPLKEMPGGFVETVTGPDGPPLRVTAGGDWRLTAPAEKECRFGFGKNTARFELTGQGPFRQPVQLMVETVVLTPRRVERRVAWSGTASRPGAIRAVFHVEHEGAAAVVVTARQGRAVRREGRAFFVDPLAETLRRARRLAAAYGRKPSGELDTLMKQAEALSEREFRQGSLPDERKALTLKARWLARDIAFGNPVLGFDELLLVKRFTQETYPDVCLNHMPWVSRPGGDLCVVSMHPHDAERRVRKILDGKLGPGHVHGMDLWWDADRIVFGYARADSDKPVEGWRDRRTNFHLRRTVEPIHLFEVNADGTGLKQLTDGEWSDLDPTYLPNGDVVFVSERCGCSLQCNEYDKDETSCNLYLMHGDGSGIRRMSVTKDGDYLPHTLDDGTIAYTRWEYQERSFAHIQSIWTIRPDGTYADALFKQHMNNPWALEDARSLPGCRELIAVATGHHTLAAGPIVIVDPDSGLNNSKGLRIVTPGVFPPEGGMTGFTVDEGGVMGVGGFYMTPWALSDTTFLCSYTYGPQTDAKGYAIYLIDVYGTKELVYRDPEISCSVPIPLRPRPKPPIIAPNTDPTMGHAVCAVANVAHGVEGVAPERIRYIRISKRDQWPYCNTYGGQRYEPDVKSVFINWTPARVIGTVPVEADGSAHFRVPVDTPVYFQLLDEDHMELRRMRSFISFHPGEQRACFGCHETRAEAPPACGVPLALRREPRTPIPPPWGERAISFLRDVQPVLDRHCVCCHAGVQPAGGLDFSGGLTDRYNRAYNTITDRRLVSRSNVMDDAKITPPLAFGSHKSKLIAALDAEHHRKAVKLSRNDWITLVTWIDLNAPYHDGFINKRREPKPYDLASDRGLAEAIAKVHAKRCVSCHDTPDVSRLDWIDLHEPRRSRFLTAPLAESAGGTQRCIQAVYPNQTDTDFQQVLQLVEQAVEKAWERPRRDIRSLARR